MTVARDEFFEHLERLENNIKQHMDTSLAPVRENMRDIQKTLYGADGRNGIVGDVNEIKTSVKNAKAIGGLLGALGGMIAGMWHKIF